MPFEIEKKLIQLEYLCDAWREIYEYDADALEVAQEQIDKAIISITQEMVGRKIGIEVTIDAAKYEDLKVLAAKDGVSVKNLLLSEIEVLENVDKDAERQPV